MTDCACTKKAKKAIEQAQRILITSHVRPDGDAIGSAVAIADMIAETAQRQQRCCVTQILLLSNLSDQYQFVIPENTNIWQLEREITSDNLVQKLNSFDLIIVLDTCAQRQLPQVGEYLMDRKDGVLVIDHHLAGDTEIGSTRLIDNTAAATGEIVHQLAQYSNWPISKHAATALFVAIATDTGWFRFSNTSSKTFASAAELTKAGANPEILYKQLYQQFPAARMRLVNKTLETMELLCDGRLAVMQITKQMLKDTGAKRGHIENIINESQQIASVVVSVLLVEQETGETRCSLRSRSDTYNVNQIANQFKGGGHARAAGLTIEAPINQAKQKLIPTIIEKMS